MITRIFSIKLFAFFVSLHYLNASFCGESALPYHLKISSNNDMILGCAKPTCLDFVSGAPSHFSELEDGHLDGFKTAPKQSRNSIEISKKTECDEQFGATKCGIDDGEWVGGIHPRSTEGDYEKLSFRCCRNSALKQAKFQAVFDLQTNQEFVRGGDVYEKGKLIGFDYISNIIKRENNGHRANYEIIVTRILCDSINFATNTTIEPASTRHILDSNNLARQKLYQALIAEAGNANNIEGVNNNGAENLQNINVEPQNGAAETGGTAATCSNIQILTGTGRGVDVPITQTPGTDASGVVTTITCASANPNAPVALNWFNQGASSGITNSVGLAVQSLSCNDQGQLNFPQPNDGTPVIVDQVECVSPTAPQPPPPQQFINNFQAPPFQPQPVQFVPAQPAVAYQPAAAAPGFAGFPAFNPSAAYLCFSADTLVTSYGGIKKRMDELEIGEWILSGDSRNGELGHTKVTSWIHKKPNLMAEFLKFTFQNGESLKITKKHYIYKGNCKRQNSTVLNDMEMVYAEKVSIYDCVFALNENNELTETQISRIQVIQERGIYAPLTETGNIIVNDILASCYSNMNTKAILQSLPTFTETVKSMLNSISSFNFLLSPSSMAINEMDLVPGVKIIASILKDILPY